MTNSDWHTRPRIQHELDLEAMRRNLRSRDWVTTLAVLALIDIAEEPRALDPCVMSSRCGLVVLEKPSCRPGAHARGHGYCV
jgi:hypothetical protein